MNIIQINEDFDKETWLQWRHDKIGASDSPIILEVSPYTRKIVLLVKKCKPYEKEVVSKYFEENIAGAGHRVEEELRGEMAKSLNPELRFTFAKNIVAIHKTKTWMIASLDGIDFKKKIIWECKIISDKKVEEARLTNKCPEKYYPQVQHQLEVTGYKQCIMTLTDINLLTSVTIIVNRDDEYLKNTLRPALRRFNNDIKYLKEELSK